MSLLPPDTIHVKRKRGADADDGPVDFLRVEGNKRFRNLSGDANWVYQRKIISVKTPAAPASVPAIKTSQEGDENRPIKSFRRTTATAAKDSAAAAPSAPVPASASGATNDHVRRFHLSKFNLSEPATTKTSKKRGAPAVFVERSAKKQKEHTEPKPASQDAPAHQEAERPSTPATLEPMPGVTGAQPSSQTIKYKRPGANARTNKAIPNSKPSLPPSLLQRDSNIDMDELARDMEAYTLSHITHTTSDLDRVERERAERARARAAAMATSPTSKSRFKPKAPAARFAQRHPDYVAERERARAEAVATATALDHVMSDGGDSTDDDDYVLETYERVPASRLRDQAVPSHRVGLLVFDTEPERTEFFFGNEDDSEDEFPEDDEDENAENYYTADYPDEDLDWDDQFDRNNYRYVKGNWPYMDDDDAEFEDGQWDRISDDVKDANF